jgi:hypothetical protein
MFRVMCICLFREFGGYNFWNSIIIDVYVLRPWINGSSLLDCRQENAVSVVFRNVSGSQQKIQQVPLVSC